MIKDEVTKNQDSSKFKYDGSRKLTDQEKTYLKTKNMANLVLGILLSLVFGIGTLFFVNAYINGKDLLLNNKNYTIFVIVIFAMITFYGLVNILKAGKFLRYMDNICVTKVNMINISTKGFNDIAFTGKFKCSENGKNENMEAPIFLVDVKKIREVGYANLYYMSDKILYLGKCMEEPVRNSNNVNLNLMDEAKKEKVLSIIRKKAVTVIVKAVAFFVLIWLFAFAVLSVAGSGGKDDTALNMVFATVFCFVVGISVLESFTKNIEILLIAKKLKKENLYWVVLPVRQCTRSKNIFVRWYRYANYEYGGKIHNDWLLIGRNPISKITCFVPESDTSSSYGFFSNWFEGELY